MISQRTISLIANAVSKQQGNRVPESVIARDYVLAWFLAELATHPLRESLAFKGGTALRRCYYEDYRFSEDLDFTLLKPMEFEEILPGLNEIFRSVEKNSGIRFSFKEMDRHTHVNSHTFILKYDGPLPASSDVKCDITIKETIVSPLVELPVLRSYAEYSDIPVERTLRVYSLEEIVVEKLTALSDPARREPRDLYDLWYILENNKHLRLAELRSELETKLIRRNRGLDDIEERFTKKEASLRSTWEQRLGDQVSDLPEFDGVYRQVARHIRGADFSIGFRPPG